MPPRSRPAIQPAPRKTLMEWIEHDDGNSTDLSQPVCSSQAQTLHAQMFLDPRNEKSKAPERLQPPPGLRLPPLG